MEWKKLKNLIILILLVVNGFLLVLVGARRGESVRYERTALDQTVQALEQGGIRVELDAVSDGAGLAPVSVERDLDREAKLAQAMLGQEVRGENRGGGLYLYRGETAEVSLRVGGELSASMAESERWRTDDPEGHAAGLLEQMGVEASQTGAESQGGRRTVRFRQLWEDVPLFSSQIEFIYEDGFLSAIHGTLLIAGQSAREPGQVLTLPTALMRFSEEIAAAGDVCSAIHSMEAGYRGTVQSLSGGVRLAPVWLVATDTAHYYLDCTTGALTRVEDQM